MSINLPTFQDLYDAAKAEVVARNPQLTDWSEGSNLDAIGGSAALLADQLVELIVQHFAAMFIDTAEGADLDALALDRFGLPRVPASKSIGEITWTKGSPSLAYPVPAGTLVHGIVEGVRIEAVTTATVALAASDLTATIPCESTATGRDQNFDEETLDTLSATFAPDPAAMVLNAARFVGGAPAETDPEFRDRIRRYLPSVRRGIVEALRFGAKKVPGVKYVTVDESTAPQSGGGFVSVFIGDPDARSNSGLAALVDTEMVNWRAAGVFVQIFGAEREEIELALELRIRPGSSTDDIAEAVRDAIVAYVDTLAPNAVLRLSRLQQVAHNAHPSVRAVRVTSHTSDIAPDETQNALRVVEEAISFTFVSDGSA